jgi:gamma-glutamyltranspeptidase/glutathione hydrolase
MPPMATAQDTMEEAAFRAVGEEGMVVTDHPLASEVGLAVLKSGGNAVDAAVATSLALGVVRPYSTGIGGGGFAVIRMGEGGAVHVLDYREIAPSASRADMYVQAADKTGTSPAPSRYGGLAVGVPGLLAGHSEMLRRFGTRPLAELIEPARQLAADGFEIDSHHTDAILGMHALLARTPGLRPIADKLTTAHLPELDEDRSSFRLEQPALAKTLKRMAKNGVSAFYRGDIARAIASTVQEHGGILTAEDLMRYKPVWRKPIRATYRDRYEIISMPPPSSGGICIAQILNILEHWDLAELRQESPGVAAHIVVEAFKHAFADRARYLGDADFVNVPDAHLTSKAYAADLASKITPDKLSRIESYGSPVDDAGTTHYCIVDRWGNIASATETINTHFGSLVYVDEWGIVLNNEMDDFSSEPGKANAFGLVQSPANAVAPGKRPLSSMSPTIVLRDGKPFMALGASGGPRIITSVVQVLLNVIEEGVPLASAVAGPRLHHQWRPNVVYTWGFEQQDVVVRSLKTIGHAIETHGGESAVQALMIADDRLIGASDPRKGGRPAGY